MGCKCLKQQPLADESLDQAKALKDKRAMKLQAMDCIEQDTSSKNKKTSSKGKHCMRDCE